MTVFDTRDSVEMTRQLGDDVGMHVLREHNGIVRRELSTTGGRQIKHAGDGVTAAA